jgi:hypothetical protein
MGLILSPPPFHLWFSFILFKKKMMKSRRRKKSLTRPLIVIGRNLDLLLSSSTSKDWSEGSGKARDLNRLRPWKIRRASGQGQAQHMQIERKIPEETICQGMVVSSNGIFFPFAEKLGQAYVRRLLG